MVVVLGDERGDGRPQKQRRGRARCMRLWRVGVRIAYGTLLVAESTFSHVSACENAAGSGAALRAGPQCGLATRVQAASSARQP